MEQCSGVFEFDRFGAGTRLRPRDFRTPLTFLYNESHDASGAYPYHLAHGAGLSFITRLSGDFSKVEEGQKVELELAEEFL